MLRFCYPKMKENITRRRSLFFVNHVVSTVNTQLLGQLSKTVLWTAESYTLYNIQKCQFAQFIVVWSYCYKNSNVQSFSIICYREHLSIWTFVYTENRRGVFGGLTYGHMSSELHRKIEEKASLVMFVRYQPGIKSWKYFNLISKQMLVIWDLFFKDPFMETDDRHEVGRGQTSCVGCDCLAHGKSSNEEEESEIVKVAPNS